MEGMIGEVRMFGGNFAPRTWSLCDGQLLAISTHTALFSIIGTIYGGDGQTTFALPDCRGRAVLGPGSGPGLPTYREGAKGGAETHTLTVSELASHNHSATERASNSAPITGQASVASQITVTPSTGTATATRYSSTKNSNMNDGAFVVEHTGGSIPFQIMMPTLVVNYVICMQGVFPSRG